MRDQHFPTLTCHGLKAGQSLIPPFEVGPGEIVKIVFPPPRSPDMHLAERLLCQELSHSQRATTVESAQSSSWWQALIRPQTTAGWLIAKCGITRQEAVEKLNGVHINPDAQLSGLAGNPRWMLGFLSALHRAPAVLVFTTSGCDPLGIQNALAAVNSQLRDCAAIYLSCYHDLKIQEPAYTSVLEAQTCELVATGAPAALAH